MIVPCWRSAWNSIKQNYEIVNANLADQYRTFSDTYDLCLFRTAVADTNVGTTVSGGTGDEDMD